MKPVERGCTIVVSEGQELALCPHGACVARCCRTAVPLPYQCDVKPILERSHNGAHGYIIAVVYNDYLKTITGIVQAGEGPKTRTKLPWAILRRNDDRKKRFIPFHEIASIVNTNPTNSQLRNLTQLARSFGALERLSLVAL